MVKEPIGNSVKGNLTTQSRPLRQALALLAVR